MNNFAFFFVEVGAGRSGLVVEALIKTFPEIKEAAAVYAESDVVARIYASQQRIGDIYIQLLRDPLVLDGEQFGKESIKLSEIVIALVDGPLLFKELKDDPERHDADLQAYLRVDLEQSALRGQALKRILECEGVIYAGSLSKKDQLFVKIEGRNKREFDTRVMETIQRISGVKNTSSMLIINQLHVQRSEPLLINPSEDDNNRSHIDLREAMEETLSIEDIQTICYDLAIDYESLGAGGKTQKIISLILFCKRSKQLNKLFKWLNENRRHVNWHSHNYNWDES